MEDMDFDASMVSYIIGQGLYYQLRHVAFFISISGECDVWPTLPLCIEKPQKPTRKTLVNKTYV